jgi:inner membrane protein
LTQGLLGASFGQALCGRKLGRQAIVWGAVTGMSPDLDTLLNLTGPLGEFVWHRSFTHSLWFGPVVGPLVGWALWRRSGRSPGGLPPWILLAVAAILTHPLLDWFTSYGTQLLHPFSTRRFTLDAVAIVDPAYSVVLLVGLLSGWRWGWVTRRSQVAAAAALVLSTGYLLYGLWLNEGLKARVRGDLLAEGITSARVEAYPTLMQLHLRRVVVRNGTEVRVGFVSLWTGRGSWQSFHESQDPLVQAARATPAGAVLEWFAAGQTVGRVRAEESGSAVEIDDLRYGFPQRPRQGLWGLRFRFDGAERQSRTNHRQSSKLQKPATHNNSSFSHHNCSFLF